jgi:xylan 1,4-beta-xylosidase
LTVAGLGSRASAMTVEEFRMDAAHSNAYAAWQRMGSPAQPTADQQRQLESAGQLERTVAPHPMPAEHGSVTIPLQLPRQGVALVRLRRR